MERGNLCVTGKVFSFQPSPHTWLWFVRTLLLFSYQEHEQRHILRVLTLSLRMFSLQVCVRAQCVVPWGGTCSGTAEWEWPWPNPSHFVFVQRPARHAVVMHKSVASLPACLPASHVLVCQRECTFHTCDHRGGSRSSKLLYEGA